MRIFNSFEETNALYTSSDIQAGRNPTAKIRTSFLSEFIDLSVAVDNKKKPAATNRAPGDGALVKFLKAGTSVALRGRIQSSKHTTRSEEWNNHSGNIKRNRD